MFNAIQLVPVAKMPVDEKSDEDDQPQNQPTRGQIEGSAQSVERSEAGS